MVEFNSLDLLLHLRNRACGRERIMTGIYILFGGMMLFAGTITLLDLIARRRRKAQKR